jgi:hypothetical protein
MGDVAKPSIKNSRNSLASRHASLEPTKKPDKQILVVQGVDGKISLIKGQQDIRKMYTPPVNDQMMPSRNPFLNGQITDYLHP